MKGTFSVTVTVDPAPLAVGPAVDLGQINASIPSGTSLNITGGTPPYQVTGLDPSSPPLPPGVTLNSDGTFTGTNPSAPGSVTIMVNVQDSLG